MERNCQRTLLQSSELSGGALSRSSRLLQANDGLEALRVPAQGGFGPPLSPGCVLFATSTLSMRSQSRLELQIIKVRGPEFICRPLTLCSGHRENESDERSFLLTAALPRCWKLTVH